MAEELTNEEFIDKMLDETNEYDEELESLFEENPIDEEVAEEIPTFELSRPDDIDITPFNIDKYLSDYYSFKEVQGMDFEEYKNKELEKPDIQAIQEIYNKGLKLKGLETFDDFILFKKKNHIFAITIGLPFEFDLFDIEPKIYICKAFSSADYSKMITANPDAERDMEYFENYMLSECILFPECTMEDIPTMETGIIDILLPAVMKHSRFNSNHKIIRL